MPSESHVLQIRLTADELATWRKGAQLAGVSLFHYVSDAVSGRGNLERVLRVEEERRKEVRRRRIAAEKLADSGLGRPHGW